jgi:uncharacterized protein YajQ (UPF0234 family)
MVLPSNKETKPSAAALSWARAVMEAAQSSVVKKVRVVIKDGESAVQSRIAQDESASGYGTTHHNAIVLHFTT